MDVLLHSERILLYLCKNFQMRSFSILFLFLLFLAGCNEQGKEKGKLQAKAQPAIPAVSRHSEEFNRATSSMLSQYYHLSEKFVQWDSSAITSETRELQVRLDSLYLQDLSKETATKAKALLGETKLHLKPLTMEKGDLQAKRAHFNKASDGLFRFLQLVKFDRQPLFLQKCPMAFNDTGTGIWISNLDTIRNPYLGMHHPYYKSGMLHCGENKEILDYTGNN